MSREESKIRLSKLMSQLGICSRREADVYIEKGLVRVDGVIVSELGTKVSPDSHVELLEAAKHSQEKKASVILNKPIGYVSAQPEKGYQPAIVLLMAENRDSQDRQRRPSEVYRKKLAVAGRLDIDSQGLLIFTQDGRLAKTLVGAESQVEKEYLVRVEGDLDKHGLSLLRHGLSLDGKALERAKVEWVNKEQLRFVLTEGRKRQIRRMCELVGLEVKGLKRVRVGNIRLGKLKTGQWRYLSDREVQALL